MNPFLLDPARWTSLLVTLLAVVSTLPAQDAATLEAEFARARAALLEQRAGKDAHRSLLQQTTTKVEPLLERATGVQKAELAFLLAQLRLHGGEREQAKAALTQIDDKAAGALLLTKAAELAARANLRAESKALLASALTKAAPLEERLEIGKLVLTHLADPERGQKYFDATLAMAKDDEQRAHVLWHLALATKEREDVDEGAFLQALQQVTAKYPDTRWGGIAKDRARAREFAKGHSVIALQLAGTKGGVRYPTPGSTSLLLFLSSGSPVATAIAPQLAELLNKPGAASVIVSVDSDLAAFEKFATAHKFTAPWVCDGLGYQTEAALRYGIESVPWFVLADSEGRLIRQGVLADDPASIKELADAMTSGK